MLSRFHAFTVIAMDFKLSYNWLKEYVTFREGPEQLARVLSLSGPSVDRFRRLREQWDKVVIGKVLTVDRHPKADRLTVHTVEYGDTTATVVCGASNVRVGMLAALALPGASVRWHGEGDPIVLEKTTIRGVESFGMLCDAGEIGMPLVPGAGKGIWDLSWTNAASGTPLVKALDADDTIFDVEVTTNRLDMFSVIGLARETAAATRGRLTSAGRRAWDPTVPRMRVQGVPVPFDVHVKARTLCPRFTGVVMTNVRVAPSPWWMQTRLLLSGIRPINNVVDITNYVMLEYGKPLHAFDADRIARGKNGEVTIDVRIARVGESLGALDGKTYALQPSMLVIADATNPIAIAGIMGGEASGVTDTTTTIVLESAIFDPMNIRATSRALALRTDAVERFEKGFPVAATVPSFVRATELLEELTGAVPASPIVDRGRTSQRTSTIILPSAKLRQYAGVDIAATNVQRTLTTLGFTVASRRTRGARSWSVTVPWWRADDVTTVEDCIEEVTRVYGYHRIPSFLPGGQLVLQSAADRRELVWERRVKEALRGAGWTEVMSYSFVSERMLRDCGIDPAECFTIANPLSDDHVYLRPRLTPSLLNIVAANESFHETLRLFELSNVYRPRAHGRLPSEILRLVGVVVAEDPFAAARGGAEFALAAMGIAPALLRWEAASLGDGWDEPRATVRIMIQDTRVGQVWIPHPKMTARFGVKRPVAFFTLLFHELLPFATTALRYTPIPKYPAVLRDLAVIVPETVSYADIAAVITRHSRVRSAAFFDLYRGAQAGAGKKSMAFRIDYGAADRTLTAAEADAAQAEIVADLATKVGASVRGVA